MAFLIYINEDLPITRESKRTQNIHILIQMHHLRTGVVLSTLENQSVLCLKYDYYDPALSYALIHIY